MDAAAAADADRTMEFDQAELAAIIYERISPYIVGIVPQISGVIIRSTDKHDVVAVHSDFISKYPEFLPQTVEYYSNNTSAAVEAVAKLSPDVTVLFAKRKGDQLPDIALSNLDPQEGVSQKVVTFFPYMNTVAMFKGHIGLTDATSRGMGVTEEQVQPLSINTFTFTAPYASVPYRRNDDTYDRELDNTRSMTLGAPVFNLDGGIVGLLSDVGIGCSLKFARNAEYIEDVLSQMWGEEVNLLQGKRW